MRTLLQLIELVTSDTITLAVTAVLVAAVLALLVLLAWPARGGSARSGSGRGGSARGELRSAAARGAHRTSKGTPTRQHAATPTGTRSAEARALFASGTPTLEVARRTGLSRDALALLSGMATASARQKAPGSARVSVWRRVLRAMGAGASSQQATA